MKMGLFQFTDIGRTKATFKRPVRTERALYNAIKPFLMSRDFECRYDEKANEGIVLAGLRQVGQFKRVGDL